MQGQLEVNSEVSAGTHFWISFPVTQAPDYEAMIATNLDENTQQSLQPRYVILHAEDNALNFQLVERLIKQPDASIEVIDAPDAEQGINLARSIMPDLIIMDIHLPGMSGYEALVELRSSDQTKHIPVIALTANATEIGAQKGKVVGFDDYLFKPVDIDLFYEAVGRYLAKDNSLK